MISIENPVNDFFIVPCPQLLVPVGRTGLPGYFLLGLQELPLLSHALHCIVVHVLTYGQVNKLFLLSVFLIGVGLVLDVVLKFLSVDLHPAGRSVIASVAWDRFLCLSCCSETFSCEAIASIHFRMS